MFTVQKKGTNWIALEKTTMSSVEVDCEEELVTADVPCRYGAKYASVMCRGKAAVLFRMQMKSVRHFAF